MSQVNARYLQALRSIDKFDKIGRGGVVELLQKPEEEFGANLDPVQAELIGMFLDVNGATNEETLNNMAEFFQHAGRIRTRVDLMVLLDSSEDASGKTKWDHLLAMRTNEDQTWRDGARPANVAWALDDMVKALISMRAE